jgi:SAM-dependent methyltransferase
MTFSKEWDSRYKENTNMSVWPWSDLVSYVKRYVHLTKNSRVLELGCGAGANIPFFLSLGVKYYSIEGSATMVNKLKKKFPNIRENIVFGDFTQNIPFSKSFDLVIDRSSLTHNTTKGIMECLENVNQKLKGGGKYVGIDWFSTSHSYYKKGGKIIDSFTRNRFQNGQFQNVGVVHFSNKAHLQNLFKNFEFLVLEHKIIKKEIPSDEEIFASWNFVAQKN